MEFIGNCVNLFDDQTGDCFSSIFDNVSHFAHYENKFWDNVESGKSKFIDVDDFNDIVGENDIIQTGWQCYYYSTLGGKVYVAYDPISDIHWFWA